MPFAWPYRFWFETITEQLCYLCRRINVMSIEVDKLRAQVEATSTVVDSAIALIQGIAARLDELKDDPVAIVALADELRADTDRLSAAVATYTPPAPPPVEPA